MLHNDNGYDEDDWSLKVIVLVSILIPEFLSHQLSTDKNINFVNIINALYTLPLKSGPAL